MTQLNGDHYCELSQAYARITRLNRLLEEANALIDILQGRIALNRREKEVLELTARGLSSKEVASELKIRLKTCECYRDRLMKKLHVHDVVRLTHCAIRLGIIEP